MTNPLEEAQVIIDLKDNVKIAIRNSIFRTNSYLDVRKIVKLNTGDWTYTKKGIAIPRAHVGAVVEGIKKVQELHEATLQKETKQSEQTED